jgi:peroxiredoxin-like protein
MQELPHHYTVTASTDTDDNVMIRAQDLPEIVTAAPAEFGGPGNRWSPESLLVAAVADCFVLTFRAIARASKLDWKDIRCSATGTLDRVERVTKFTEFQVSATLRIAAGTSPEKAERLLHKAEETCLITNSLTAGTRLTTEIEIVD